MQSGEIGDDGGREFVAETSLIGLKGLFSVAICLRVMLKYRSTRG